MPYLLLVLVVGALIFVSWRAFHKQANASGTRIIGPDDDPEFLRRLGHGDNNPR